MALELTQPDADLYTTGGEPLDAALARTTHLAVGAHADDLEIMAWHGIVAGGSAFAGVVCTDGRGAPRGGPHAALTDDALRNLRREEQRTAATAGSYAAMLQLDHPSDAIKAGGDANLDRDLRAILAASRPAAVYTHNPLDAHATHIGVCLATLAAIRKLPAAERPHKVWGCEVWRSLDWTAEDATLLRLERVDDWKRAMALHDSQIEGGRAFPDGAAGRAAGNAVFCGSHRDADNTPAWLALDLTPLVTKNGPDLETFVFDHLERFAERIGQSLAVFAND